MEANRSSGGSGGVRGVSVEDLADGASSLRVRVYGTPQPKGSPKPVWSTRRRRRELTIKTAHGETWELNIATACQIVARQERVPLPFSGAVRVDLYFFLPRPVSVKARDLPAVPPDGDKLERAVWDALQRAGVLENDSRVTSWTGAKRYADGCAPGVAIMVSYDTS